MNTIIPEATEIEYNIAAKVKFVDIDVKDHDRQYKRKIAILIPQESTQTLRFFSAWLPEVADEYFELAGIMRTGVYSPCRLAILKSKKGISDRPYLMVMSKGIEEELITHKLEGKVIDITILPENSDHIIDEAKDSGGSFSTIHGQETL